MERLEYHEAIKVALSAQNQEIKLQLPGAVSIANYEKMIVTVSSTTDALAVKAYSGSTELKAWYNQTATETKDLEFNLSDLGTSDGSIDTVGIMANNAACDFIFYRVAFVPRKTSGGPTVEPLTIKAGGCWYWSIEGTVGVKDVDCFAAADGSVSWPITGSYKEFRLQLPTEDGYDLSKYTKVEVDFTSDQPINVSLWPIQSQQKNAYDYPAPIFEKKASGTVEFDLTTESLYQAAYASDSYTDFDLREFGFVLDVNDVTANVKVNSITLK